MYKLKCLYIVNTNSEIPCQTAHAQSGMDLRCSHTGKCPFPLQQDHMYQLFNDQTTEGRFPGQWSIEIMPNDKYAVRQLL